MKLPATLVLPLAAVCALWLAMLACQSTVDPDRATLEAYARNIQASATAGSSLATQTGAREATVQAEATGIGRQMVETQAAQRAGGGEVLNQSFQPQLEELSRYNVDPGFGRLGWIQPPVTIDADGYLNYDYGEQALTIVAQDFMVSADINWDSQFTSSGCGVALRTNGIPDAPSQYLVLVTRETIGHVLVSEMIDGRITNSYDLYTYGFDPAFNVENRTTNRLVVVMIGSRIDVYTNGALLGSIDVSQKPPQPNLPEPPVRPAEPASAEAIAAFEAASEQYIRFTARMLADHRTRLLEFEPPAARLDRGFVALAALNDTGTTRCTFENAWLWLIE